MTETDFNDYGLTQESNVSMSQEDSPNDFYGGYFNTQENENNKTQANLITQPNSHITTNLTNNTNAPIPTNNTNSSYNLNQNYNNNTTSSLNNSNIQSLHNNSLNNNNTNFTNDYKTVPNNSFNLHNQLPNTYVNVQKIKNPTNINSYNFNKNIKHESKIKKRKDLKK